jgi:hypothetical protein
MRVELQIPPSPKHLLTTLSGETQSTKDHKETVSQKLCFLCDFVFSKRRNTKHQRSQRVNV